MRTEKDSKKDKTARLIYRIVLIALLSVFVGGSLYTLNARRVFHNAMPMPFGVGASVVLSGSMEPTLSVNDLVFVVADDSISEGDVIVFQSGDSLVIHRVTEIGDGFVVTRGDANNTEDDAVSIEAVKGRMAFSIPFVGLLIRLLQTVPGTLVVIALAVFLMNRSWKKEREDDNRELDEIKEEIRRLKEQAEQNM